MQFKNPELLYALFLLLIPIFIHLFQLRKFQKTEFTNVAFLKKVKIQTRKSSQIKKWLTLLMRLLALACLIIAFAQPFTASKTALNTAKETIIYLDNSFSMQAAGKQGPLLERATQDLFNQLQGSQKVTWFTNNTVSRDASVQDFKNTILKTTYSPQQLSAKEVVLKASQLFSKDKTSDKNLIYISDFQQIDEFPQLDENSNVNIVQVKPNSIENVSIDSLFIISKEANSVQLAVVLKASTSIKNSVTVSLFNKDVLQAKTAVNLAESETAEAIFTLEATENYIGRIEITDANINYDNSLFFNINKAEKIKVLAINEANGGFLERLFTGEEFEFIPQDYKSLNYNDIPQQNLIVLNQLKEIPVSLITSLNSFSKNGGSIVIIPSQKAAISTYNNLLSSLNLGSFSEEIIQEKKISKINFDHPLYKNVFEKQVANFQNPRVNSYYKYNGNAASALSFEDGSAFLTENNQSFLLTAAIDDENSNFKNSPLIVPSFYNIALQSLPLPKLYYTLGNNNIISVNVKLSKDEILSFVNKSEKFIPLQQTKANSVQITTVDEPNLAETYSIESKNSVIEPVSFNYNRKESNLTYADAEDWEGAKQYNSIADLFETVTSANEVTNFWKWFAIFGLLFLIAEMMILKFLKN